MRQSWKKIGAMAALGLLACLLLVGCSKDQQKFYLGYIEGKFVYVAANVSGKLEQTWVSEGSLVKAGQALFQLQQMPALAQVNVVKFQLKSDQQKLLDMLKGKRVTVLQGIIAQQKQASSQVALAHKDLKRYQQLYKDGAVGKQKLDSAQTDYQSKYQKLQQFNANLANAKLGERAHLILAQEALVEMDQAKLNKAQWSLSQTKVSAPVSGRVFSTFYRLGEYVPTGQAVLSILSPKYMRVLFYVPEQALSQIKIGQTVAFTCDGCAGKQTAKVNFISPQAEYTPPIIYSEVSRSKLVYRIEAVLPANVALKFHPGQPLQVYLVSQDASHG